MFIFKAKLVGTQKQIDWAHDIRADVTAAIRELDEKTSKGGDCTRAAWDAIRLEILARLENEGESSRWIDLRHHLTRVAIGQNYMKKREALMAVAGESKF